MAVEMIAFKCPECGRSLTARPAMQGKTGKCKCGATFTVPHDSGDSRAGKIWALLTHSIAALDQIILTLLGALAFLGAAGCGVLGYFILNGARSAVHEIEAGIAFVIGACLLIVTAVIWVGMMITSAIRQGQSR